MLDDGRQGPESVVVRLAARAVVEAAGDAPLRVAFAERGLRAIARLMQRVDERTLTDASTAESDDLALLRALLFDWRHEGETVGTEGDPLAEARLAGLGVRQRLLRAANGLYSNADLAALLGVSRQTIDRWRGSGKLLGLPMGGRAFGYPRVQVQDDVVIEGLPEVLSALDGFDPWSQLAFLLSPNTWLDASTPISVLQRGEVARVVEAAAAHGEQLAA